MKPETSSKQDIKNILIVLTTAVICAGLLASVFLFYYGPTGRYIAGKALLDPAVIDQINAGDIHSKKVGDVQFHFDRMEFSYFDERHSEPQKIAVPSEKYQKFYSIISSEKSLEDVPVTVENYFKQSRPMTLTLFMRTKDASMTAPSLQIFQLIQFVREDYFRVQLRNTGNQDDWAYFYHLQLYLQIMQLFTPTDHL